MGGHWKPGMEVLLGSRGSTLALRQVEMTQQAFSHAFPQESLALRIIKTSGDKKQGTESAACSDKRDWIDELEAQVVEGKLHAALHCGKDVPCTIHPETLLLPILPRACAADIFIGRKQATEDGRERRLTFEELPQGARVGTASLRRRAQLLRLRPDLELVELRGNVPTRVQKLDRGDADGIVLAAAGVERLTELQLASNPFPTEQLLPAVNQGMLCIQLRKDESALASHFETLVSREDAACFYAERRVAEVLNGDCRSAIGIYAHMTGNEVALEAAVYSHDGVTVLSSKRVGRLDEAAALGDWVGEDLLRQGAAELLFFGRKESASE